MTTIPDRLITSQPLSGERKSEPSVRPIYLNDYIGQTQVHKKMKVFIEATKTRAQPLDHVLFSGPAGLGKTTLAHIVANELQVKLTTTSGPVLQKPGDLAAILTHLSSRDVLFIDEIHRLNPKIEELLYPALDDYQLDIFIGEGPNARSIKLDIPPFTLIGATTRTSLLTPPLLTRFGIIQHLQFYNTEELADIITRSARILNITIDQAGAVEIAQRARNTPRVANRLLRRVCDFATVNGNDVIDQKTAKAALSFLEVDEKGLDQQDRTVLLTLLEKFHGGPVGLDSLAVAVGDSRETLENVIEPFLVQQGFILRTLRGRIATALSYQHFNLTAPEE